MTVIDFLILIVCLFFTLQGMFKGFLLELFSILALVAGLVAAIKFYPGAAVWFESIFPPGPSRQVAGFIALFLVVWILIKVMSWVLSKNMGEAETHPVSRLAGGALGLAKIVIFFALVVFMAEKTFPDNKFTGSNFTTPVFLQIADRIQHMTPMPELPDISG